MTQHRGRLLLTIIVAATVITITVAAVLDRPSAADLAVAIVLPFSFLGTGAFVTYRQPWNLEAWLLTLTGPAWALALVTPFDGSWALPVCLMTLHLPLRFPDGRLPSARWRWFSWSAVALTVTLPVVVTTGSKVTAENTWNPYYLEWTEPFSILLALLPVAMLASVISLVVRYRRSESLERHQVRWIAWAGAVIVSLYTIALVVSLSYDRYSGSASSSREANWFVAYPWWVQTTQLLALGSFLLIPASFAIAILRYRLYDIDRLISRTVTYVLVSGALLSVYVGVVALAGFFFSGLDNVGVAVATLCAAALTRPLLRRIQRIVDRRFNRSGYDAQVITKAFSADVADEVDPLVVVDLLSASVNAAVEPSLLSTWVRDAQTSQ